MADELIRSRVTMWIDAPPSTVYEAFVEPARLEQFWLSFSSRVLAIGEAVEWRFMVEGAVANVTARTLEPGKRIVWAWDDGVEVAIDLEALDDGTAITLISAGFPGDLRAQAEAALDNTEGFAIVLCDLKTLLETGASANLTRGKAKLIEARR